MNTHTPKLGKYTSLFLNIGAHYREFILHANYRGPNFNWTVPLKLAWYNWRATKESK
jgi:hypothetical protein